MSESLASSGNSMRSSTTTLSVRQQRKNTFLEKIKLPEGNDVVKEINTFLKQLVVRFQTVVTMQQRGEAIHEFINSMHEKLLANHPLWKKCSPEEASDILEGLERYVTVKLFRFIFPPAVPIMAGEKKPTELLQDDELSQKIDSLWFIERKHLDIRTSGSKHSEDQLAMAITELTKINEYKTPLDKIVIILNVCRILTNLCTSVERLTCSADDFLPLLIYVIIKSNPPYLVSNIEYVAHYRNPSCIDTETHYYLTNFVSSVSFIRDINAASLSIDPAEYDRLIKLPVSERQDYLKQQQLLRQQQLQQQQQQKKDEFWTNSFRGSREGSPVQPVVSNPRSGSPSDTDSVLSLSMSGMDDSVTPALLDVGSPASSGVTNMHLFKFRDSSVGELRMQDISELLSEYKWLVRRVSYLEQQIQSSSSSSSTPSGNTQQSGLVSFGLFQSSQPQQQPQQQQQQSLHQSTRSITEADVFGTDC